MSGKTKPGTFSNIHRKGVNSKHPGSNNRSMGTGNALVGTTSNGKFQMPALNPNQWRRVNAKIAVEKARKEEKRVNNALNNAAKELANAKKKQNELSKAAAANVNNVQQAFKNHQSLKGKLKAVRARVATALGRN